MAKNVTENVFIQFGTPHVPVKGIRSFISLNRIELVNGRCRLGLGSLTKELIAIQSLTAHTLSVDPGLKIVSATMAVKRIS